MEGKVLQEVLVSDKVMPFVKVVRKRPGKGNGDSDAEGDGTEDAKKLSARKQRKVDKRKKNLGKGIDGPLEEQTDAVDGDKPMDVDEGEANDDADKEERKESAKPEQPGEPLLAIQKIVALHHSSSEFLIFSAHGFVYIVGYVVFTY